jgi:molybdenum cofactor cytidylyltransferase
VTEPFVSCVVLAAGESSRMGQQKALLPWEGSTLLAYQLAQLSSVDGVREVVVVTGHESAPVVRIADQCPIAKTVHNSDYKSGKVSSIVAGLSAIAHGATDVLLLAVDQPRPADITRALVREHVDGRSMITVPVHAGRRGHPVVFRRALLPELIAIDEASEGIRAVLQRHRDATLEVAFDDPIVLVDLNRPSDVPAWLGHAAET